MSPPERVRVLIVDDSALMRKLLADLLGSCPRIEVVGAARDGTEAIRLTERLRPDVVTLDVAMPGLSGLETLPALLEVAPVPVVMVSAFTTEGAEVTLEALERGAVDFLPKPDRHPVGQLRAGRELLVAKVLAAARCRVHRPASPLPTPTPSPGPAPPAPAPEATPPLDPRPPIPASGRCAVLGISTGGPQTLTEILSALRPPVTPLLIVQHMPAAFTPVLAGRLDRHCPLPVKEAAEGDLVRPDQILIAPGGRHMRLAGRPPRVRVALGDDPPVSGHRPSVDVLFRSAAEVYGPAAVGIIMTGMGRDGVEGCKQVLAAGGMTYGQDEATSVVYGMNKAAFLEGAVRSQITPTELPEILSSLARD